MSIYLIYFDEKSSTTVHCTKTSINWSLKDLGKNLAFQWWGSPEKRGLAMYFKVGRFPSIYVLYSLVLSQHNIGSDNMSWKCEDHRLNCAKYCPYTILARKASHDNVRITGSTEQSIVPTHYCLRKHFRENVRITGSTVLSTVQTQYCLRQHFMKMWGSQAQLC